MHTCAIHERVHPADSLEPTTIMLSRNCIPLLGSRRSPLQRGVYAPRTRAFAPIREPLRAVASFLASKEVRGARYTTSSRVGDSCSCFSINATYFSVSTIDRGRMELLLVENVRRSIPRSRSPARGCICADPVLVRPGSSRSVLFRAS